MKANKLIFLLVFLGVIVLGLFYLYENYQKPQENLEVKYENLNILGLDSSGNKIRVGYDVYVDGGKRYSGNTSRFGASQHKVRINSSVRVLGKKEGYYNTLTDSKKVKKDTPLRVELDMKSIGFLDVEKEGRLGKNLTIILDSTGLSKNLGVCMDWSFGILRAEIENAEEIENPSEYKKYFKCQNIGSLENEKKILKVNYEIFNILSPEDYIEFVVFDRDEEINNIITRENQQDIGMENLKFQFKY